MWTLLLALLPTASAGEGRLVVEIQGLLGLRVDGYPQAPPSDAPAYIVDVPGGPHTVSLHKGPKTQVWSGVVEVPADHEVRCLAAAGQFTCQAPVILADRAMVMTQVTTVQATPTTTVVTAPGVAISASPTGAAVAVPGATVVVSDGGGAAYVGVPGAYVMTPTPQVVVTTPQVVVTAPVATPAPQPQATQPPPPPLPASVKLVLRSLDGEWADVVVDGKVVAEFRNQDEMTVTIKPGKHQIEIREFMDAKPYTTGRLDTGYASEITFGLREGERVTCYDHDGYTSN
jgi:hypothetical protein